MKFANTKLGGSIDLLEGQETPQRDRDGPDRWAKASELRFNQAKCQLLPLGHNNTLKGSRLEKE